MNVPQLRFKGFEREYNKFELNNLCLVVDCQHSTAPIESAPTIYKMIRTSNVRNGKLITKTMDSVSEETYNSWSIRGFLSKDDVILTREAPMGEVGIIQRKDVKYFLGQRVLQLKSNEDIILSYYLYLILQSATFKKYIQPIKAGGSTVSNIRIPELKKMEFLIPRIEEQTKKINFFKLINSRIEKQQEKIEKLEQFKKGMMQKIFSQELRFKDEDGGEFPEWENKILGDVFEKYKETVYVEDNITYNQITISKTGEIKFRGSKLGLEIGRKRQFMVDLKNHPHTLTFIRQGVFDGAIGFIPPHLDNSIVTENMPLLGLNINYSKDFIRYYLQSSIYKEKVIFPIKPTGSAQQALHERDWLRQSLAFPCIKEQIKVAKFFNVMQMKINVEKEMLELIKLQRIELMNKMFV